MKLNYESHYEAWERVIEQRLRHETSAFLNQLNFILGKPTVEIIYFLKQSMKKYSDRKKDLYIIFLDIEGTSIMVSMEIFWWILEKEVTARFIDLIKDIYDSFVTSIRTIGAETREFPIAIGLHQGST